MVSRPDGGYGWIVCAIACWISSSFGTFDFGFGVILGPSARHFQTTTSILSLGGEMISVVQYLFAPAFGYLGSHCGYRKTLAGACAIAAISIAASGFVKDIITFVAFFCIVPGLCFGQMMLSSVMILNTYFDKKLVIVHGFFTGAMTLGATLPSVAINFLVIDYGLQQVTIFLASMFLVCLLMIPFFYQFEAGTNSEENKHEIKTETGETHRFIQLPKALFYSSVLLFYLGFNMFYVHLVEIVVFNSAEEITTAQRSLIVLTFSLINGVAKIILSWVTNYFEISPQIVSSFALIIQSFVLSTIGFITEFYLLLFLVALVGICNAPFSAFTVPTAVKLFGDENSDRAIGILYVCVGLGSIPGAPIQGLIFESTGSYTKGMVATGFVYSMAALCNMLSSYFHVKYQNHKSSAKEIENHGVSILSQ